MEQLFFWDAVDLDDEKILAVWVSWKKRFGSKSISQESERFL